ncbi:MAG: adenylate/guanylate cyclase domain-containing response regulator [Nitrospirae bacterium]|nr:adenylate/guanylate cyclase domain-containing response regulator [Nitrospirota bacterium]
MNETPAINEEEIFFADEEESGQENSLNNWKILIVDDEEEVHRVTKLALRDFIFEGKGLEFIYAFTSKEGLAKIKENPDVALILLDVVMETDDAGLTIVKNIRNDLKNLLVRIVLRTGQPGHAPQKEVILNYDINDYKEKSDLTSQRLFTTVVASLKSYKHVVELDMFNHKLEAMIDERTLELRNEQKKVARAQKAMARYVAPSLVQKILDEKVTDVSERKRCKLTLFFSDIKEFTSITDSLEPEDMAGLLNEYLTNMQEIVNKYDGTLANIIGDALYIFFGAPDFTSDKDHAVRCVKMAVDMQKKIKELQPKWYEQGIEFPLLVRCGINTGVVTVGSFGSNERAQYTAFGMPVNIASRLEGICPSGEIIISHQTWALVKDDINCAEFKTEMVKGFHRPIKTYKVIIE